MFSGAQILKFQHEASVKAARNHLSPHVIFSPETAFDDWRSAPFVGEHVERPWRVIEQHEFKDDVELSRALWPSPDDVGAIFLADTRGVGADDEPALSAAQQKAVAALLSAWASRHKLTVGVGLIEVGQFQAVVRVYAKGRHELPAIVPGIGTRQAANDGGI
jgi:hypothetical protein